MEARLRNCLLLSLVIFTLIAPPLVSRADQNVTSEVATPFPHYIIRMQAIRTANDDGSQPATVTPNIIASLVNTANHYYAPAGIRFVFDPTRDMVDMKSTLLNMDITLPSNVLSTGLDGAETQHIVYRGANSKIYELYNGPHTGSWLWACLSDLAGAPLAMGNPVAYTTDAGAMHHVVYLGQDNRIHELFIGPGMTGWAHTNVTDAAAAPTAASDPAAYVTDVNTQHIVYRGSDMNLYELYIWPGAPKWYYANLTQIAQGTFARGTPFSYASAEKVQNVVYAGQDGHIHRLWYDPAAAKWQHRNLSQSAGAPQADGYPAAYLTGYDEIHHVVYKATDGQVIELYWRQDQSWLDWASLTQLTGAPLASEGPRGYITDDWEMAVSDIQHVIYRGADKHIYELFYRPGNPAWQYGDLTALLSAPGAVMWPEAYTTASRSVEHINYRGTDNNLYELWYAPGMSGWALANLTQTTGAPPMNSNSAYYSTGIGESQRHADERNRIAARYSGKLVVYFRYGNWVDWDKQSQQWVVRPGYNFSGPITPVMIMGAGTGPLAHEMGHYFHLGHTFSGVIPYTLQEAADAIKRYVDVEHHPANEGLNVFDGDRPWITDTLPDAGPSLWQAIVGDLCSTTNSIAIPVTLASGSRTYVWTPDRTNLMSYFDTTCAHFGDPVHLSPQQIARVRAALEGGNRQHLIAGNRWRFLPMIRR